MREENVTINIIKWLQKNDWDIISYDFPQSGTGILLHPNKTLPNTKNKGSIIPDIIAQKGNKAVIFENKDRFVLADFNKIKEIKESNMYSDSISKILDKNIIDFIFYGVGMPNSENNLKKSNNHLDKIDFLIMVDSNNIVSCQYEVTSLF